MSRKAWLIIAGLALVWLSPLVVSLSLSSNRKSQQEAYQKRVEAWNQRMKEHIRPKYSEAERLRLRAEFAQAMKEADDRWAETEVRIMLSSQEARKGGLGFAMPLPTFGGYSTPIQQSEPYQPQRNYFDNGKPDLTGVYWTYPLKAGQGGWQNVQINYVYGPE